MRGAGDLRDTVTLKKRVPVIVNGVSRDDWEQLGTYSAEVLRQSARSYFSAGAEYDAQVCLIHIRTPLNRKLTTGLRAVTEGLIEWDVEDVIPNRPSRGFTELRARRISMEGVGTDD